MFVRGLDVSPPQRALNGGRETMTNLRALNVPSLFTGKTGCSIPSLQHFLRDDERLDPKETRTSFLSRDRKVAKNVVFGTMARPCSLPTLKPMVLDELQQDYTSSASPKKTRPRAAGGSPPRGFVRQWVNVRQQLRQLNGEVAVPTSQERFPCVSHTPGPGTYDLVAEAAPVLTIGGSSGASSSSTGSNHQGQLYQGAGASSIGGGAGSSTIGGSSSSGSGSSSSSSSKSKALPSYTPEDPLAHKFAETKKKLLHGRDKTEFQCFGSFADRGLSASPLKQHEKKQKPRRSKSKNTTSSNYVPVTGAAGGGTNTNSNNSFMPSYYTMTQMGNGGGQNSSSQLSPSLNNFGAPSPGPAASAALQNNGPAYSSPPHAGGGKNGGSSLGKNHPPKQVAGVPASLMPAPAFQIHGKPSPHRGNLDRSKMGLMQPDFCFDDHDGNPTGNNNYSTPFVFAAEGSKAGIQQPEQQPVGRRISEDTKNRFEISMNKSKFPRPDIANLPYDLS
ncbi:unnamed protein product [Amoebophrya sp. A120]|nr:unnamed protein product [Amoebophrya sp. A120]|eukprot:GSA120T00000739001.1